MKESMPFSIKKRILSFKYAYNGLRNLLNYEHNSRIYLAILPVVVILGLILKIEMAEWAAIVIVSGIVFISELFNSAIEELANLVNPEWDKKIGRVKDYAAGAVLVSAAVSVVVGILIFLPKIMYLIYAQ